MTVPGFSRPEFSRMVDIRQADGTRVELVASAEECAALMVTAIEQRQRLLITSARGKQARWLKLLSPGSVDKLPPAWQRSARSLRPGLR